MRFAGAVTACVLCAGTAAAQVPVGRALPDPLSLLGGEWRATLLPAGGFAAGANELRAAASVEWIHDHAIPLTPRLSGFGVRAAPRSWAGAGLALRWTVLDAVVRSWLEAEAVTGVGNGARTGLVASGAAAFGQVTFEFRSMWLENGQAAPGVEDEALAEVAWPFERRVRYSEALLGASHSLGPLTIEGSGGVRFGENTQHDRWGNLSLAVPLHRNVRLVLSGGTRPDRPERGELGGDFLMLGLRLQPSSTLPPPTPPLPPRRAPRPTFQVERGRDSWVLSVRAPDARVIELNGDLSAWTPLRLGPSRSEPGVWRTSIDVPPGVYHVVLRIDEGAWIAPPGLAAVPDGYGGEAGLLELRSNEQHPARRER